MYKVPPKILKQLNAYTKRTLLNREIDRYEDKILQASIDLSERVHKFDNWSPKWIK
jgi:hypothetical protein